ncbi:MAG: ATP-binding protein [Clostridiales bacterium]|jgi:anti-sigma regulatory factor (Ser/Thr protein kinase)|nr:ATP-binding protein [Eubacteriales bacterium]MDH7565426.1 ATP-binding protein [Clostridiales bacterium]
MRDLSLHLMDILQNSIAAKASKISVFIYTDTVQDELRIVVEDNGMGMEPEQLDLVADPFATSRSSREVGLGIPLFKASAERASGCLTIESMKGKGTIVTATFKISHIDRLPLGNVAETMVHVILSNPQLEVELTLHDSRDGSFHFSSAYINEMLGEVSISDYEIITWIRDYIDEGIKSNFGGVLNEIDY